jgi:endonuclease-3 related protein
VTSPQPPATSILMAVHDKLLAHYGPQSWWPTRTGSAWEIMLGAVLTQRTTWTNVEMSLSNMLSAWGKESLIEPEIVRHASDEEMAAVLRPTGFYASKFRTLKNLAGYMAGKGGLGGFAGSRQSTEEIRNELLALWGIGPETADAILLYALGRATFIGDAYALRLASRWGLIRPTARYEEVRALFMHNLPHEATLFNEYHALIVTHAKAICRSRPECDICPLNSPLRISWGAILEAEWRCPRMNIAARAPGNLAGSTECILLLL